MKHATETAPSSMIYRLSLMKTGRGIREIIRLSFQNLRSCNVGITDRRDLLI
jgi:hypothetical protein